MTDQARPAPREGFRSRLLRLVASPGFQSWASRFPLTRRRVRREGEALFDLVSGFVQSQALAALVELRVLHHLADGSLTAAEVAPCIDLPEPRAELLLNAGVAIGLLTLRRGRYAISIRGAALTGVPGLERMIAHHGILYRDLADPVAFLRGETDPELARFWPYVFGGGADAADAARYSRLMAESQELVAEETLRAVDLSGVSRLLDVGGGTGVFAAQVAARAPGVGVMLFDLPEVLAGAGARLAGRGVEDRVALHPGSFRAGELPRGADTITLVRVLYDHSDDTVRDLLAKVRRALPPGGRLIVSEPMTGGERPHRAGDVYFAFYCRAMGTGRARSQARIAGMMREAGFERIRVPRPARAFVTSIVEGQTPMIGMSE